MICKQLTCLLPNLRGPTEGSPIVGIWQICWMNEQMEPHIYLVLHFSYLPFMASVFALMTFYFFLCLFPKKIIFKTKLIFFKLLNKFFTNFHFPCMTEVRLSSGIFSTSCHLQFVGNCLHSYDLNCHFY